MKRFKAASKFLWMAIGAVLLMGGMFAPQVKAAILFENFEDGIFDPRISIITEGSFDSLPGIKNISDFGSSKAFGFGRSQCGANCFNFFMTTMKIEFPSPTFVSTLSFKEMELYGNWGSGGKIFVDGEALTGGDFWNQDYHNFGRLPYNDWQADSTYRIKTFKINQYVTMIELKVWDITNISEIFIDDLLIFGDCTPPPSGMVSWWGGDNNTLDIIGTSHGILINGTTFAPSMVGHAFSFDGVDDYIEMPSDVGDFGSAPFTVDFWMYSNNSGNSAYIMGKSHPDGGQGWDIRLHNGKIRLEGTDGWNPSYNWESNGTITPNTWYHIAISATTNFISVYINGVLDGITTRSTISSTTNPFRIGFTTNYGGTPFNGLIDEVEIFNRALTVEEIAAIYNAGPVGKCRPCAIPPSNMISWWRAENNANDSVGTNHGTLMNGVTFANGMVGQAFSFDGVDDYVEIPKVSLWDFGTNSFSITAWFKTNEPGFRNIVRYDNGYGQQGLWGVRVEQSGKIQFLIKGDFQYEITTDNAYTDRNWHFVAAVRDATEGKLKLYIDGYPAANDVSEGRSNLIGTTSHRLAIGAGLWGGGSPFEAFKGLIDEVTIYNHALTAEEIQAIYNAGSKGKCAYTAQYILTVTKTGNGCGTVTSNPAGINCGVNCSEKYNSSGTVVTLTATPEAGSTFAGWSGDADCLDGVVTINGNKACAAIFSLVGCNYEVYKTSYEVEHTGGTYNVSINTTDSCNWNASTTIPWIKIVGNRSGTSSSVTFEVLPNGTGFVRTGNINIESRYITILQKADLCSSAITLMNKTIDLPVINLYGWYVWARLKYFDDKGMFRVETYGEVADISPFTRCQMSTLTHESENWILNINSAYLNNFNPNYESYWGALSYVPTTDGYIWFELINAGLR